MPHRRDGRSSGGLDQLRCHGDRGATAGSPRQLSSCRYRGKLARLGQLVGVSRIRRRRRTARSGDRHHPQRIEPADESDCLIHFLGSDVAVRYRPIHSKKPFLRREIDQIFQDLLAPRLSRSSIPKHSLLLRWRWDDSPTGLRHRPGLPPMTAEIGLAGPTRPVTKEAAIATLERQHIHPNGAQAGTKRVVSVPPDRAGPPAAPPSGRNPGESGPSSGCQRLEVAACDRPTAAPVSGSEQARAGGTRQLELVLAIGKHCFSGDSSSILHPPVRSPAEAMREQVPGSRPEQKRGRLNEGTFGDSYQQVVACPKSRPARLGRRLNPMNRTLGGQVLLNLSGWTQRTPVQTRFYMG